MGITLGDAILYITGDDSKLGKTLNDAGEKTRGWAGNLGGTVATLAGGAIIAGAAAAGSAIIGIGAAGLSASTQIKQSQNDIMAGLGATEEEAKQLGAVALNVFKNNFAGSIEEATAAVVQARQQLGDLSDEELQDATENAFRLADTFDVDVASSFNAAKVLMEKFGVSEKEAFDLMTTGFQRGLNSSGDFLDSITEYGGLFGQSGADAGQFFSVLESGLQGGVLGTDKAADMFKEFSVRIVDGSKTTNSALAQMFGGFTDYGEDIEKAREKTEKLEKQLNKAANAKTPNPERIAELTQELEEQRATLSLLEQENGQFTAGFASFEGGIDGFIKQLGDGTLSTIDAFSIINEAVAGIEDPLLRNQIGVALMGTQFEDLGAEAAAAINTTSTSMDDLAGATDKLNVKYDNFGAMFEGIKRKALVSLAPIGDKLLGLANKAMPYVEQAFGWFEKNLPVIIDEAGKWFDWLVEQIQLYVVPFVRDTLVPAFREFGGWLINEGIPAFLNFVTPIIQQVIPGLQLLGEIILNIATTAWPYLSAAIQWAMDNMNIILPILGAVGIAILAFTSPITLVIGAIVLLATAWANNWGGIQEKTQAVMDFILPYIETAMAFIQEIIGTVTGYISQWWAEHGDNLITVAQFVWAYILKTINDKIQAVWLVIQVVLAVIQKFWDDWGQTIMLMASLVWDNIKTIVKGAMDLIGYIIDAAAALIRGDWDAFGQALQDIWRVVWETIETLLNNAKTALIAVITNMIRIIKEDHWQPFVDKLKSLWSGTWDAIKQKATDIKDGIKTSVEAIVTAVKTVWNNFLYGESGLVTKWNAAWDAIKQKVADIKQGILDIIQPLIDAVNALRNSMSGLPGMGASSSNSMSGAATGMSSAERSIVNNNYYNLGGLNSTAPAGSLVGEFQALSAFNTT